MQMQGFAHRELVQQQAVCRGMAWHQPVEQRRCQRIGGSPVGRIRGQCSAMPVPCMAWSCQVRCMCPGRLHRRAAMGRMVHLPQRGHQHQAHQQPPQRRRPGAAAHRGRSLGKWQMSEHRWRAGKGIRSSQLLKKHAGPMRAQRRRNRLSGGQCRITRSRAAQAAGTNRARFISQARHRPCGRTGRTGRW